MLLAPRWLLLAPRWLLLAWTPNSSSFRRRPVLGLLRARPPPWVVVPSFDPRSYLLLEIVWDFSPAVPRPGHCKDRGLCSNSTCPKFHPRAWMKPNSTCGRVGHTWRSGTRCSSGLGAIKGLQARRYRAPSPLTLLSKRLVEENFKKIPPNRPAHLGIQKIA